MVKLNVDVYLQILNSASLPIYKKNNWNLIYLVICHCLLVVCGCLLVVCGCLLVVCGDLWFIKNLQVKDIC